MSVLRHRLWQLLVDAAIVAVSWWLAFELRFDKGLPVYYAHLLRKTILLVIAIKLAVFIASGFYNRWWRYVSVRDMWSAFRGVVVACLVADLTVYFVSPVHNTRLPRSIAATDLLLTLGLVAGARLAARTVIERPGLSVVARGKEVVVIGAGDAGRLIVQEMQRSRMLRYTPIGFVDDDPRKRNSRIMGVRVLGTIADLPHVLREHKPDEVLIAMPSVSGEVRARIVEQAQAQRVAVKTLPGLYELITGEAGLAGQLRPVQVEDVLGREQVEVDFEQVAGYLKGHTVLVTGAGGSIGSELCRQIARVDPARLILVDSAETALFEIERELVGERDFTPAVPKLIDVKDRKALRREVFEQYRPTVVFHAAAYKHVPLMETHPLESVRNNVVATQRHRRARGRVRRRALRAHLHRQGRQPEDGDGAVEGALRMGRRGARPPPRRRDALRRRALRQRAQLVGQRDPDLPQADRARRPGDGDAAEMTRFFMTIPEAVSLVVQAGAIGGRGQVFVLDMGEPVKIIDLAQNMIRLSGKEPVLPGEDSSTARDIRIQIVGSRPGEKLHEELWGTDESVGETAHPKIMRLSRPPVDAAWLEEQIDDLALLADAGDTLEVVAKLGSIVRAPKRVAAPEPGHELPSVRPPLHRSPVEHPPVD